MPIYSMCAEDKLINLMGSAAAEEKPTPMSDPISRKSPSKHESNVLLDFLAPATTANMVSSSSAPNLADLGGKNETSGMFFVNFPSNYGKCGCMNSGN